MSKEKREYMLLFRSSADWHKELSPEELQRVMGQVKAWFDGLSEKGLVKGGRPLGPEGRTVTGKGKNLVVSDGPFAESKETVGGYTIILANNLDEAVKLAEGCPPLVFGGAVEIRPIMEECSMMAETREGRAERQLAGV